MILIEESGLKRLPVVNKLAHAIWPSAYGEILSHDQLTYMLDKIYALSSLENQFLNLHHNFIIASDENMAVGFASFSFKEEETSVFHLHKIYVLPSHQGSGTGKILLDYVINEIKKQGATILTLNVNRYNKARYFYEKKGFTIRQEVDIEIGEGYYMNDYVMELSLQ
jgi:GNAT superfamily N-acetyltransferase